MVLELLHVLLIFGLLVELLLGLSVPFEEPDLEALGRMELVRAGTARRSVDLYPRCPQRK